MPDTTTNSQFLAITTKPRAALAVRLANEGVPLRAIARAINTPSEEVRKHLREAQTKGRLLDLPREDWPIGLPRDKRALQLSRMMVEDKTAVVMALRLLFSLTATQSALLLALMQSESVAKDHVGLNHRTIDVHICNLRRRLNEFEIAIKTDWGHSYKLSEDGRKKITDMLIVAQPQRPAA